MGPRAIDSIKLPKLKNLIFFKIYLKTRHLKNINSGFMFGLDEGQLI